MQFETHVATQEIYEAATLPSRAHGELLPSEQPRLSFAERVPVGVTGVIAPSRPVPGVRSCIRGRFA